MENILTEVFQKALVIDDKKEEVDNLISHLEKKNIKTVFIEPNDENSDDYFKKFNGFPWNLIFLDLYLNSMAGA
jgi:PleD family two-component response regulator